MCLRLATNRQLGHHRFHHRSAYQRVDLHSERLRDILSEFRSLTFCFYRHKVYNTRVSPLVEVYSAYQMDKEIRKEKTCTMAYKLYLNFPPIICSPWFMNKANPFLTIKLEQPSSVPFKERSKSWVREKICRPIPQWVIKDGKRLGLWFRFVLDRNIDFLKL